MPLTTYKRIDQIELQLLSEESSKEHRRNERNAQSLAGEENKSVVRLF